MTAASRHRLRRRLTAVTADHPRLTILRRPQIGTEAAAVGDKDGCWQRTERGDEGCQPHLRRLPLAQSLLTAE